MSSAAPTQIVPSKTAGEENFPVASLLLAPSKRATIMAYYHFARHADDIADSAELSPEQKVAGLDALDAVLHGQPGSPAESLAATYRRAVAGDDTLIRDASELLVAFRRDALRNYCADWADLMEYCRYSAAPVGRFLLDLHGESQDSFPACDALCAALQVLNHLQDCGKDLVQLDRVYIPRDWLAEAGLEVGVLTSPATPAALRAVLDRMLDATDALIAQAKPFPAMVKDLRLRLQTAMTVRVAERLSARLRKGDPLATRVKLGKGDAAAILISGIFHGLTA